MADSSIILNEDSALKSAVVDEVLAIASELEASPGQVAMATPAKWRDCFALAILLPDRRPWSA